MRASPLYEPRFPVSRALDANQILRRWPVYMEGLSGLETGDPAVVLPVLFQVGAKAEATTDIFASRVTSPGLLFWCC
jgi:hypothetical protein